jgi:hypothetical protein
METPDLKAQTGECGIHRKEDVVLACEAMPSQGSLGRAEQGRTYSARSFL